MHTSYTLFDLGVTVLCAASIANAAYVIEDTYDTTNFFSEFDFFADKDPTEGFVKYSSAETANISSLAGYASNAVCMYFPTPDSLLRSQGLGSEPRLGIDSL